MAGVLCECCNSLDTTISTPDYLRTSRYAMSVYLWARTSPYIPNLWVCIVVCIADYATVSSGKDGRTVNMGSKG
jgi:hypothetical protein